MMLDQVVIHNFALVEDCTISFKDGLNILSGETGSGKSLIAASLAMLCGCRGDSKMVRTGTESCEVSGSFFVKSRESLEWLRSRGIEDDDGMVLVRRTLKKSGRGSIQVQNVMVTRDELSEFASTVFDLHGQHEQYTLVNAASQMRLVDAYANLGGELSELRNDYAELVKVRKEIADLESSSEDRRKELDLLSFSIDEIDRAKLKIGEEEELESRQHILADHDRLIHLANETSDRLNGAGGAVQSLKQAKLSMEQGARIDKALSEAAKRLDEAFYEVSDLAAAVKDYIARDSFDPDELDKCQERLFLISSLKKKYGGSIEAVLAYSADAKKKCGSLADFSGSMDKLLSRKNELEHKVAAVSESVSKKRKVAAAALEKKIEAILRELGMPKSVFHIAVEKGESSQSGIDSISFMISPNAGEPLRSVSSAVSGGEISRLMLAIKSAFVDTDPVDTILFDEIDAGIGGEVAVKLGRYLSELAKEKQVICITHLATIAAMADCHIRVWKSVKGDRTATEAAEISGVERTAEVARMLSGKTDEISLQHARALLGRVENAE